MDPRVDFIVSQNASCEKKADHVPNRLDRVRQSCTDRYSSQFRINYFTDVCSGSEEGSYSKVHRLLYHSTLILRVIKREKRGASILALPHSSWPNTLKLTCLMCSTNQSTLERKRFYAHQHGGTTEGPSWWYPRPVLGAIGPYLEPFCGLLSPKVDKIFL